MPQNNPDISGDLSEFATKTSNRNGHFHFHMWWDVRCLWQAPGQHGQRRGWIGVEVDVHLIENLHHILSTIQNNAFWFLKSLIYIYIYVNIYICILHDIQWNVVFFWVKLILNDGKPFGSWAHKAHNTYPQTVRRFLQGHLGQNAMEIIRGHDVAHDDCELVSVKSWLCT